MDSSTNIKCPFLWLLTLFLHGCSVAAGSVQDLAKVQFSPLFIHDLVEEHNATVDIKVSFDKAEFQQSQYYDKLLRLSMRTLHDEIATADKSLLLLKSYNFTDNNNGSLEYEFNTLIDAHFIGKTALEVRLISVAESTADIELLEMEEKEDFHDFGAMLKPVEDGISRMDLWVIKVDDKLTIILVVTLIILFTIANILMGCELDLPAVLSTIKTPAPFLIACFTQFALMPLIAYVVAQVVLLPRGLNSFALGLFVTGCSPGGGASNFWTLLMEGNVNLSITMTLFSTIASIAFIPLWMNLLGHQFLQGHTNVHVKVPYLNIVSGLSLLVVPLLIGICIAKTKPNIAAKARKILRPFVIFVLIFVIVFGTLSNLYMFKLLTWSALLAGFLLPWCGFMLGCFSALIFGQKPANVTAIAIETGIQNTGIAIMLLKFSFQQPDADISALMPVLVACFTAISLLFGYGVHGCIKWIKPQKPPTVDLEKENESLFVH